MISNEREDLKPKQGSMRLRPASQPQQRRLLKEDVASSKQDVALNERQDFQLEERTWNGKRARNEREDLKRKETSSNITKGFETKK